jgi:hypothetical protein
MHTFFHGWRRKLGIVTLVMTLAIMGLWARSYLVPEQFAGSVYVGSADGIVTFGQIVERLKNVASTSGEDSYQGWAGVGFGRTHYFIERLSVELIMDELSIPYWTFVLPLTVLSAYLILWKPRKQKTSEHPANPDINSN